MKALLIGLVAIAMSLSSAFCLSACMLSSQISRAEEAHGEENQDA